VASPGYIQQDAMGVFPSLLLLMAIVLAALGVLAHAMFL